MHKNTAQTQWKPSNPNHTPNFVWLCHYINTTSKL